MTHPASAVKPEIPAAFRAQMARAHSDARLWNVPFVPLDAERQTVDGTEYAVEYMETGGFLCESGKGCYEITITHLPTGQRAVYGGAWAKTRRLKKSGEVSHTYSHPAVKTHSTWAAMITALITHAAPRWQGQVAA